MPVVRQRYRLLDYEGEGIDKLVFQVDAADNYSAEAFILVGPDGEPLGTANNPLKVAGGTGGQGASALDVTDRPSRDLGHADIDNFPTTWDIADRLARVLGHVVVDNWPATQPVAGTFWQTTQPVSGPLTDAQLRALAVAVSGPLTDAQLRATALPVSGTVAVNNFPATQPVSGPLTDAQLRAGPIPVQDKTANTLGVTATGAAGAAVTATLPALGAGLFQYIELIEITMYSTAARAGTATAVVVTSTNLPAAHAWTFPSAGAIGTTVTVLVTPRDPIRAAATNQTVTIVCPATASVIWRVNVIYGSGS